MANGSSSSKLIVPGVAGLYEWGSGLSYPLIRFFTGLILAPHGAQKLFGLWGGNIDGTAGFFGKIGLEPALELAYLVGVIELVGGLMIAFGLLTRPWALVAAIELLVAAFYVHFGNGFFWGKSGYEYPLLWSIIMFGIFFKGGGRLSVDSMLGKEF